MDKAKMVQKARRRVGIRWRLMAFLAAFTILLLLVIWVFQIRLLGYFYEREKFSEMKNTAALLAGYVADEDLAQRASDVAMQENLSVRIYVFEGENNAHSIVAADARPDGIMPGLSDEILTDLYQKALANGGTYDQRMDMGFGGPDREKEEKEDRFRLPGMGKNGSVNVLYAQVIEQDGDRYFMLIESEMTPVTAITNTLQTQFIWIALCVLLVTVLFAFLLSRMIAAPLNRVTAQAGKLAAGNYTEDFKGRGYREVEELSDTLNYAAREIGAADRLQKELIANISHDLRTPLTMIKGYSEVMRDIPGENNAENAQVIIDETTRLSELVNDLLDISKLQAGTKKPDMTRFDLTALIRDTMTRYDALVAHEGYRIECQTAGEAPVMADRTMILQVLYNLINNAVNYTGDSRRVRVTETVGNGVVKVAVADDGEGIPKEQIKEIWDRYYRVDAVHKRAVMGTGLGLSIVKSVLEAHDARYGVESALGVGSVFWFELPLADPAPEN